MNRLSSPNLSAKFKLTEIIFSGMTTSLDEQEDKKIIIVALQHAAKAHKIGNNFFMFLFLVLVMTFKVVCLSVNK